MGNQQLWHIVVAGNQKGPCTGEELRELYNDGTITERTYAWSNGMPEWLPLASIPALQSQLIGVPELPQPDIQPTATETSQPRLSLRKSQGTEAGQEAADQVRANQVPCPGCGAMVAIGTPICPHCTFDRTSGVRLNAKKGVNMAANALVERDLIKWGWMLMGFGLLNLGVAFFAGALGANTIIIKIFSVLQMLAGLATIIIFKRYMYILIITMTLLLAILNLLGGGLLLAIIQFGYGFTLIGRFVRTKPKPE